MTVAESLEKQYGLDCFGQNTEPHQQSNRYALFNRSPEQSMERSDARTAAVAEVIETTKEKKTQTFYLRLIEDNEGLDLDCRIVYSWLWSWNHWNACALFNPKRYTFKKITNNRLVKGTGFDLRSVKSILSTLQTKTYIDAQLSPKPDEKRVMRSESGIEHYRTILLIEEKDGSIRNIRQQTIEGFIETQLEFDAKFHPNAKRHVSYYTKALGIHRATFFRALNSKKPPMLDATPPMLDATGKPC